MDVFPPLMVNMTRAGEVGGFLDSVLLQIADSFEAEVKLRGKIKAAMTYPVAVLVMAVGMTIGMLIFVVPTFETLFSQLGGELPAPTLILVLMSKLLKFAIVPLIIAFALGLVWWRKVKDTPRVRGIVDPMKLKLPVFGGLFQKIALARFTGNLGTMVRSGVPMLQALDIVADTSGNVVIASAVRDVQSSVRRGESLAAPLAEHPVFPSMVVQMLAVGEDTGALDTMLAKISEFYRSEVEATTDSLTSLIEPIMIAILGGIVGSMIVALYLPIFKVFDLVGGK
jgi:type IV pilus assembly protein PilC